MVCDYWSGFIEVERLQSTTTSADSKALKITFARYGVSNVLVTDNGPQFSSAEFLAFLPGCGIFSTSHHLLRTRNPMARLKVQ